MPSITVNVSLYGSISRFAGGRHLAQFDLELVPGSNKHDLLASLGIPEEERGFLFINAVLHDVPGLNAESREPLKDGDHIGIFSTTYMWPYQYRDGIKISEGLRKVLLEHGSMHHSYALVSSDGQEIAKIGE
jgi:hypothetical protein